MSHPSWQKRCGEVNGYDHEAASECHASLRELETELEAVESFVSGWMYESAVTMACVAKLGMQRFNRYHVRQTSKAVAA